VSAVFSPCRTWRYRLERDLGRPGPVVALLGVNPSIAAEEVNDQTIRKDMGFGERHGCGRIIKGNKFAFCSTDIKGLRTASDPRGPENDAHLVEIMRDADQVIACWGRLDKLPESLRRRWRTMITIAERAGKPLLCFGTAKDGQPLHTSRLAYDTPLVPWKAPR
jgi:hypothetical protein